MTSLNVSCDGMPLGSSRKRRSHASFTYPKSSMLTQSSYPPNTAQSVIMTMSSNLCSLLRVWRRGSGKFAKNGWGFGSIGMSLKKHVVYTIPKQFTRTLKRDCPEELTTAPKLRYNFIASYAGIDQIVCPITQKNPPSLA